MFLEPRRDAIEYLEHLIQEAAGNAYKTRLLAERILYELSYQARSSRPDHGASPAARRSRTEESPESDAESGWRLVRYDWQVRWRNWRRMLCPPSQFREAPRENGRYGRWTFVFTRPPAFAPVATLPAAAKGRPSSVPNLVRLCG